MEDILNQSRRLNTPFPTSVEQYRPHFASRNPDLGGILDQFRNQFEAPRSGVYLARSIDQILATKRLDGCHEWGLLWIHVLRSFGVRCSYIQGVDVRWLDEHGSTWRGDGWRGHVFIDADLDNTLTTFCSTSARIVTSTSAAHGERIIDGTFVVLFEGDGPADFDACTQDGINTLLGPLVKRWIERKRGAETNTR